MLQRKQVDRMKILGPLNLFFWSKSTVWMIPCPGCFKPTPGVVSKKEKCIATVTKNCFTPPLPCPMANEWFSSWLQGPGSTRSSIQRFQRASLGWYLFKRCEFEWFWHRVHNSFVGRGGDYVKFVRFQFHGISRFICWNRVFFLHVGCLFKGDAKEWHSRQHAQPMLGWSCWYVLILLQTRGLPLSVTPIPICTAKQWPLVSHCAKFSAT